MNNDPNPRSGLTYIILAALISTAGVVGLLNNRRSDDHRTFLKGQLNPQASTSSTVISPDGIVNYQPSVDGRTIIKSQSNPQASTSSTLTSTDGTSGVNNQSDKAFATSTGDAVLIQAAVIGRPSPVAAPAKIYGVLKRVELDVSRFGFYSNGKLVSTLSTSGDILEIVFKVPAEGISAVTPTRDNAQYQRSYFEGCGERISALPGESANMHVAPNSSCIVNSCLNESCGVSLARLEIKP